MGYELSDEKLNKAFQEFKKLADRKKEITEDDLITLLTEQQVSIEDIPLFELKSVQVSYGTDNIPTATASVLTPQGDLKTIAATGAGSVEAIFNTLEQLVKSKVNVLDFQVKSVSKGRDALADAVVNVRINGAVTTGRDSSQDVLEATANAFIDAINRNIIHENIRQKQTTEV